MTKEQTTENDNKTTDPKDLKTAGPFVHKNWTSAQHRNL